MTDIWGFLIQTLTASGAAVLLLCLKAMLRDKLSPRWQFAVWGVLAAVLLLPAGRGGRYVLVNWPLLVETAKTALTGEYTLTRVIAPIPLPGWGLPGTAAEWVFAAYCAGVVFFLLRYLASYIRLRRGLKRGAPARGAYREQLEAVAARYALPVCPAVETGVSASAFVCGVFSPILAVPAGAVLDDKVLLHELLHLKYRDAAWGLVICLFRCLHWCNPLLWYCAGRAENDLESLCDQRVLERLEGEDRRDYGRVLLSMANEKYARTPGASSIANGGKNIARRIEAIARFKRYPAGMALASVCVALVLLPPLTVGTRAEAPQDRLFPGGTYEQHRLMAAARSVRCTTYAGALDTYAKAVLMGSPVYRAMCAPLSQQEALAQALWDGGPSPWLDAGLPAQAVARAGYYIYNLVPDGEGYRGLLAVEVLPDNSVRNDDGNGIYIAFQPVQTLLEGERWVVLPLGDFYMKWAEGYQDLPSLGPDNVILPEWRYEDHWEDFTVRVTWFTACQVPSSGAGADSFDPTPYPDGEFVGNYGQHLYAIYGGDEAGRAEVRSVGVQYCPLAPGQPRPELEELDTSHGPSGSMSSNTGEGGGWTTRPFDRGDTIGLGGGGGSAMAGDGLTMPASYAASLYVNGERAAELTLLPVEGSGGV